MIAPAYWEGGMYFDTDGRAPFFWYTSTGFDGNTAGTWAAWFEPGFEIKPMSNLTFRFGPEISRVKQDAQYVDTIDAPEMTNTYGQRYVFGELDQTTFSANIRLNVSFTPNLSLQTFVQPLISAGKYTNMKELAAPRSYSFNEYGDGYDRDNEIVTPPDGGTPFSLSNPDFNFKSLRGNAVLRWEYMPGSAFYFVWTQERTDFEEQGNFDFNRDANRLWSQAGDNIFLAKVTYYLTR